MQRLTFLHGADAFFQAKAGARMSNLNQTFARKREVKIGLHFNAVAITGPVIEHSGL